VSVRGAIGARGRRVEAARGARREGVGHHGAGPPEHGAAEARGEAARALVREAARGAGPPGARRGGRVGR
jgi:hypothetical protein